MSVFKLQSNKQFMGTHKESPDIHVMEYKGDHRDFKLADLDDRSWGPMTLVGPSPAATFKALEVYGVTIEGDQLLQLIQDLKVSCSKENRGLCLGVNRQGLCFVDVRTDARERRKGMRINDLFGWSKYGVAVEVESGDVWSVCDMSSGEVLMGPPTVDGDGGGVRSPAWEKVMEKTAELLRKSIEEKEKEAVALKAALKVLTSAKDASLVVGS